MRLRFDGVRNCEGFIHLCCLRLDNLEEDNIVLFGIFVELICGAGGGCGRRDAPAWLFWLGIDEVGR